MRNSPSRNLQQVRLSKDICLHLHEKTPGGGQYISSAYAGLPNATEMYYPPPGFIVYRNNIYVLSHAVVLKLKQEK